MDLSNTLIEDNDQKYLAYIENAYKQYLAEEIYFHFGLSINYAQLIEKRLADALYFFDLIPNAKSYNTAKDIILFKEKNYKSTMGKLITHLKKVADIPTNFKSSLEQVCEKRNFLVHSYFHKHDFTSIETHEEMVDELKSTAMLFNKTLTILNKIVLAQMGKAVPPLISATILKKLIIESNL